MLRRFVALTLAVPLALGPLAVRAEETEAERSLRSAAALYENLEYERALEQLKRAKTLARTPEEDVRISLYQGAVLADMGRRRPAMKAFRAAFSLDPDAKLPIEVSPKVHALMERVRKSVHRQLRAGGLRRLREARDARKNAAPPPVAEPPVVLETPPVPEGPPPDAPPPPSSEPPIAATDPTLPDEPASAPTGRPSIRAWAWLPGVAGLFAAGGGTFLYLRARQDYAALQNGSVPPEQAVAVRQRGQAQQIGAFALFGVGAAGLLTAAGILIWGGPTEAPVPSAWVTPEGGGVAVSGSF